MCDFRLSLVSILVFITTITKLVVKEQLRVTVSIHRYHHNTYFGLTVKKWKSAAGKRQINFHVKFL